MEHRAVVDRPRQIRRVTAAAGKGEFHAEDAAVGIEADLVVGDEVVTLAGDQHVVVAVGPKLHGTAELLREQRGDAGEQARLAFLAAESASHPAAVDDDVVGLDVERMSDLMLDFAGMLRRAVDEHGAVFLRQCVRDHAFEVELVLAADVDAPRQPMRSRCDRGGWISPLHPLGRKHERMRAHRCLGGENRLQVLVFDDGKASGAPRLVDGTCGYREDRLADVLDECGREDRIVGDDGAIVVLAGDVLRGQHGDDARRREHFREVDRLDPRVRTLAHPDRRVQRPANFSNVVGVERLAADVEMRAVVGDWGACPAGRMLVHVRRSLPHATKSTTCVAARVPEVSSQNL